MASSYSFDVVSEVDMQEVLNAVNQSTKEMSTRYDFKNSASSLELNQKESYIIVLADDKLRLKSVLDILKGKLVKRKVPLKCLGYGRKRVHQAA